MVRQIEQILTELGWTDGFHIPVANDENKALEAEVEAKLKDKAKLIHQLEELADRVDALNKHAQNVNLEKQQNQILITAHRSQLTTEESMYKLAKAEQNNMEQELKQINKNFAQLGDRHNALQNEIFRHADKLEKLKATVKWDKDALMAWEEELSRSDENNNVLLRYTGEDVSKARELELKRQRLRMDVESRKKNLEAMLGEVSTLEQVLERTGQMFRKVHQDRQDLISQWEGSVRVLQQRDKDINRTLEEITMTRSHARERAEELREQQRFFESEVNNNQELERQVAATTRGCDAQRKANQKLASCVEDLSQELTVMKRTLLATGSKLEHKRSQNSKAQDDLKSQKAKVEELQASVEKAKKKLHRVMNQSLSSSERAKQMEEMLQGEERLSEVLNKDVAKLLQMLFRAQIELRDMTKQQELQGMEMSRIESSKVSLRHRSNDLDKELLRQKEIVYVLDFAAQKLESRIAAMTGDMSAEERETSDKKVKELEKILAERTTVFNMLTSQVQRLEDTMRRLTSALQSEELDHVRMNNRRQDQVLMIEGGEKQLEKSRRYNQERQVEENLLRLRVKNAETAIRREDGEVYSLEKQRLELESAMQEREVEIGVQKDMLRVQKHVLNEDKSRLFCEIRDRRIRISQLQKKTDIAILALGTDEDGEQISITNIKIKSAQEKYMLQEQGDELDAKIRKAEREILAMENTLKVVNNTNDTYKKNLSTVDKDGPEYQEKSELESQYYVAVDKLRHRRSQLKEITADVQVIEQTVQELTHTEDEIRAAWKTKDQEAADLDRELCDQQTKLQRAEKQLRKLIRELRGTTDISKLTLEEKDIDTRELQEQNQSALQQLAELVARRMETGPVVGRYLQEKGLSLPCIKSSLAASSRVRLMASGASSTRLSPSVSREGSTPSIVTLDAGQLDRTSTQSSFGSKTSLNRKTKKK